jgi:hypothetical protein
MLREDHKKRMMMTVFVRDRKKYKDTGKRIMNIYIYIIFTLHQILLRLTCLEDGMSGIYKTHA